MIYFCCDERRRSAVRLLNGIDAVLLSEPGSAVATGILNAMGLAGHDLLLVRCFGPVPDGLSRDNVKVTTPGVGNLTVAAAKPVNTLPPAVVGAVPDPELHFVVAVAPGQLGAAILHTLTLEGTGQAPLEGFRPALMSVEFPSTPRGVWHPTTDAPARAVVRDLNGIDYVEVVDAEAALETDRQRQLKLFFVKPLAPGRLVKENISIEGGERIRDIKVEKVVPDDTTPPHAGQPANMLEVWVDRPGDFSTYTLRLIAAGGHSVESFDPLLSAVAFSFKVECPDDFDCRTKVACPPEQTEEPEIDYLAKDYDSFRRLMLDRFSVLMPEWGERNAADLGVVLVEMLAYVGDHLSYQQDAVATEAYLGTARLRSSVRRHARLVDYFMHDGSNARVWAQCSVTADRVRLPKGTQLFTKVDQLETRVAAGTNAFSAALSARPEFFETLYDFTLYEAHNEIAFYAWGERECCLPAGATRATLCDGTEEAGRLRLRAGDVLVFQERRGPDTGKEEDADPGHRHAVRLTRVAPEAKLTDDGHDREPGPRHTDPLTGQAVVEVEWAAEDALPFPLCLSAVADDRRYFPDISVALGNVVLADHGRTIKGEWLEKVPKADERLAVVRGGDDCCEPSEPVERAPRFRPRLKEGPLTFTVPLTRTEGRGQRTQKALPASSVYERDMRVVLPAISLRPRGGGIVWRPKRDLLSSDEFAPDFVAEVEEDGRATLRFGDDEYGMRPAEETEFLATYRVGNGARGNIGADSLAHIVTTDTRISAVTNPLPAGGGRDPESIENVQQSAPSAFRTQERAITPEDYAEVAGRHPQVQRAAATMRWTGSWLTVFLNVDRLGGRAVDEEFKAEMRRHLERYRLAGHDLEINGPSFVPLEVELYVCILTHYFRSDVRAALLEVLSNRTRPDGLPGLFHPDNFTFGQSVYRSTVEAAAQGVEGVRYVAVKKFTRFGSAKPFEGLEGGRLPMGRLEIARLDNSPNFPENGVLRLTLEGGR
jgi:hypothetical protein